ncbi:PCMD domain-containing protein [Bacteroidales bacterium OttesenSCG-928-J19]|nr:PCMD domain-containing protein [Bacteroidales bacterium OttesenSCG-928-J19]
MNIRSLLTSLILLLCLGLSSCIQDEPLYREADIESLMLPDSILVRTTIDVDKIEIILKNGTDIRNLAPELRLSPGASVVPESGTALDFSKKVVYTVTSEDGNYQREYEIKIDFPKMKLKYDFEDWGEGGAAWKFPQYNDLLWSSANSGVATAFLGKVSEYPTRSTTDAYSGEYAAEMKTIEGKKVIIVGYIPVFPGSFFTGSFQAVMSNPLKSTRFGQIHPQESGKPVAFNGYYKYQPGEVFIDKNGEIPGRVDKCSIYAILFKVTKGEAGQTEYLDGINIMNSDKVVARAIWGDASAKPEYTYFTAPFEYSELLDYTVNDYKLALVFSSSRDGDRYEGAIGSTLIVDDVEVVCEEIIEITEEKE